MKGIVVGDRFCMVGGGDVKERRSRLPNFTFTNALGWVGLAEDRIGGLGKFRRVWQENGSGW